MFRRRQDLLESHAYERGDYGLAAGDVAAAWLIGAPRRLADSVRSDRSYRKVRWVIGRARAFLFAALIPGLTVDRHSRIARGCTIRCEDGGRIDLRGATLAPGVVLEASAGARLTIGDARVSWRSIIAARDSVTVGDGVSIGDHVTIRDHNHAYSPESGVQRCEWISKPVHIGDRAWIGSKATILAGVHVGDRALVAAGAVVTRDVPAGTRVAGVPAAPLR